MKTDASSQWTEIRRFGGRVSEMIFNDACCGFEVFGKVARTLLVARIALIEHSGGTNTFKTLCKKIYRLPPLPPSS